MKAQKCRFVGHKNDTWKTNTFVFDWAKHRNKLNVHFLFCFLFALFRAYNNYFIWCTRFNSNGNWSWMCAVGFMAVVLLFLGYVIVAQCIMFRAFPRSHLDSSLVHGFESITSVPRILPHFISSCWFRFCFDFAKYNKCAGSIAFVIYVDQNVWQFGKNWIIAVDRAQ